MTDESVLGVKKSDCCHTVPLGIVSLQLFHVFQETGRGKAAGGCDAFIHSGQLHNINRGQVRLLSDKINN